MSVLTRVQEMFRDHCEVYDRPPKRLNLTEAMAKLLGDELRQRGQSIPIREGGEILGMKITIKPVPARSA